MLRPRDATLLGHCAWGPPGFDNHQGHTWQFLRWLSSWQVTQCQGLISGLTYARHVLSPTWAIIFGLCILLEVVYLAIIPQADCIVIKWRVFSRLLKAGWQKRQKIKNGIMLRKQTSHSMEHLPPFFFVSVLLHNISSEFENKKHT